MRSEKEIGKLTGYSDKVNEAYKTYASLYLDFIDDNLDRFYERNIDLEPLNSIPFMERNEDNIYDAYIKSILSIVEEVMGNGYFYSFNGLYEEYPLLMEYTKEIEELFYDERDGL